VAPAIQPRALMLLKIGAVGPFIILLGGIGTTWAFFLLRCSMGYLLWNKFKGLFFIYYLKVSANKQYLWDTFF
jgi:hypothetical protein